MAMPMNPPPARKDAGNQKQPPRREQEHEKQVAPTIAPGSQMGGAVAPIGAQRSGHFTDRISGECRFGHHLGGELHAGTHQAQPEHRIPREAAQAAMKVADIDAEKRAAQPAQHRVAEVAMQRRHRSRCDAAFEPVPHHQVRALAQFVHEAFELTEIVAVVAVAHDHESPRGGLDTRDECGPVAPLAGMHDACAQASGQFLRAVGGAVVADQNLGLYAGSPDESPGFGDAGGQGPRLIEARHQDGQFHGATKTKSGRSRFSCEVNL